MSDKPTARDPVHEGFVGFFKGRNLPVPYISKYEFQFTKEEFERFAEQCADLERQKLHEARKTARDFAKYKHTIKTQ